MGNCMKYDKIQDVSISLAYEAPSKPDDPDMPDCSQQNPGYSFQDILDGVSNPEEPIVGYIEIDHYKRPMLKRSITTLYTKPVVALPSPKRKIQSRRHTKNEYTCQNQLIKHSFLFKAKEKLRKSRTSFVSYASNEPNHEYITEDSTGAFYSSLHPESTSKLGFYISSPKGDDESECSLIE